jgi:hypothetical protein
VVAPAAERQYVARSNDEGVHEVGIEAGLQCLQRGRARHDIIPSSWFLPNARDTRSAFRVRQEL